MQKGNTCNVVDILVGYFSFLIVLHVSLSDTPSLSTTSILTFGLGLELYPFIGARGISPHPHLRNRPGPPGSINHLRCIQLSFQLLYSVYSSPFEIYDVSARTRGEGVSQCRHFADKVRG